MTLPERCLETSPGSRTGDSSGVVPETRPRSILPQLPTEIFSSWPPTPVLADDFFLPRPPDMVMDIFYWPPPSELLAEILQWPPPVEQMMEYFFFTGL